MDDLQSPSWIRSLYFFLGVITFDIVKIHFQVLKDASLVMIIGDTGIISKKTMEIKMLFGKCILILQKTKQEF